MDDFSRRGFIATAGGALATAWLSVDATALTDTAAYAARAAAQNPPPPLQFFTPEEAADLDAMTALIIPSDDTPGAREAHAVVFIDRGLATWAKNEGEEHRKALVELRTRAGGQAFASQTPDRQRAIITDLEKERHQAFFLLRAATIMAMFSNPEHGGNFAKIGWKLIGFDDRFSWAPPFGWYDANA